MKRTPLRRKKPLKRSSRIKQASAERRKLIQDARSDRDTYRAEFPKCQCCAQRQGRHVHEIARGPARAKAYTERCCWLHLCQDCHELTGDYSLFPIARQLAIKARNDPKFYDLKKFLQIRGRGPQDVTQEEVDRWH